MTHPMTAEEFFESLTGFDELAIKKAFGVPVTKLPDVDAMEFARALVFVAKTRDGMSAVDAKHASLSMTIGEVTGFFADDEVGLESGKDETKPVTTPSS